MPIFCQKIHSLKNTALSCHFFQIFHEKPPAVMPIFGQKNVNSVKTTLYYGPKKSIGCPFFSIFFEKPPVVMFISGKKYVNSVKTTLYYVLWAKKVDKMPFFSDFLRKNQCS